MATSGPSRKNARLHGRVLLQDITCSLGRVMDLSASGMRVRARTDLPPVGTRLSAKVSGLDCAFYVSCVVKWKRRVGLLSREAGITFDGLSPEQKRALSLLARTAASNERVGRINEDAA